MKRWTVAVTGMNARPDNPGPGYAVARCLRESGAFRGRLVGLGYDSLDPGLYCRDVLESGYLLPYPSAGEDALFERLLDIHKHERLSAVIPCLDAELPVWIALAPRLAKLGIRSLLPNGRQLEARAKDRLPELCERVGLSTPETRSVSSPGNFDRTRTYPLVVKGAFYDATVAYGPEEAVAAFERIRAQWGLPVLSQRFLEGQEYNLTGLGDGRGNLLAPVMMRKQALTDKGKAWAGVAVDDPEVERLARTLVQELRWPGPFEAEVMRTGDGAFHLIEMNPRFPAWVYLSHGVGRNLPLLLLKLLDGESELSVPAPRPGTMFLRRAEEQIVELDSFERILTDGVEAA